MLGLAYFMTRRHDEAIAAFERSQTRPYYLSAWIAASLAHAGKLDRAKDWSEEALQQKPDFSARVFASKHPFKVSADREHLLDGLRKAGLPD
jgi:hypothetical protein